MVVFPDFWVSLSYRRPTEGALTTNLLSCSLSGASRSCYWPLHVRQSNLGVGCAFLGRTAMDDTQVGWIAAIIIGGVAGYLAEQFMKSEMGLVMNIVLGIIGGGCQRHIELLWCPPRGKDRLPDCWVHRGGLADLGLADDRGTPASLNRAHLAHATHDCGGFGVVPNLRRALG